MGSLLAELERRWRDMFTRLAAGEDLPPGVRLRAEGLMEAAALLQPGCEAKLAECMDAVYRDAFGRSLEDDFGADWQECYPFPQIPAVMRRAPVYPSTRE